MQTTSPDVLRSELHCKLLVVGNRHPNEKAGKYCRALMASLPQPGLAPDPALSDIPITSLQIEDDRRFPLRDRGCVLPSGAVAACFPQHSDVMCPYLSARHSELPHLPWLRSGVPVQCHSTRRHAILFNFGVFPPPPILNHGSFQHGSYLGGLSLRDMPDPMYISSIPATWAVITNEARGISRWADVLSIDIAPGLRIGIWLLTDVPPKSGRVLNSMMQPELPETSKSEFFK